MKRRITAILLALGLSVSAISMGVYAEEATEQITEAAENESAEDAEAVTEAGEDSSETEIAETETAETETADDTPALVLESYLEWLDGLTDDEVETYAADTTYVYAGIVLNWQSVKQELGNYVGIESAEISADGSSITGYALYDGVSDSTDVKVTFSVTSSGAYSMNWDVEYPMSVLLQRAALNTVMGLATVFLALLFLSFLISKLHYLTDFIEGKGKSKSAPAPAAAPAPKSVPAAAPAPAAEEISPEDDLELIAVITAAVAAVREEEAAAGAVNGGDAYIVRSIKKIKKRNWQRA